MAVADRIESDYRAITEACGLLDRSERGKLALTGADAKEFLNGQLTNDVLGLTPGTGCYAAFLTHKGKMLGDVRVLDTGTEIWLDTERDALQELFNMIRRYRIGYDTELHKRTLERGLISLLGPGARGLAGADELPGEEHANAQLVIDGIDALSVVTDVGIDLICDGARTADLVRALESRGAVRVGEEAAECLRIERGRPRYGVDIDDSTIPQEAGLNERAVSFTKGCYTGQETVARLYYKGKPNRHLRGLLLSGAAQHGDALALGDKPVGKVGSVALSPRLGPIALALVRREAQPGDTLLVGGGAITAEIAELPLATAASSSINGDDAGDTGGAR